MKRHLLLQRHLLQRLRQLHIILRQRHLPPIIFFPDYLPPLRRPKLTHPHHPPRHNPHPLITTHRQHLAFHIPTPHIPLPLIHGKGPQSVRPRVLVRLDHHPRRCIRDAQVQHLAGGDEVVEGVHDLWDGGGEVPIVEVEEVDVRGLEVGEGVGGALAEGFEGVSDGVGADGGGWGGEVAAVFCCEAVHTYEYLYILRIYGVQGSRGRTQSGPGSRGLSSIPQAIARTRRLGSYWHCLFSFLPQTLWCILAGTHVSMKFPPSS